MTAIYLHILGRIQIAIYDLNVRIAIPRLCESRQSLVACPPSIHPPLLLPLGAWEDEGQKAIPSFQV